MNEVCVVMFDIDGTLVDSNFLHVEAWDHAFTSSRIIVDSWRIQRAIGADSDVLLDLVVPGASTAERKTVADLHRARNAELAPRLRSFNGAEDLIAAIAERGVRVVLATSAPQDELERVMTVLEVNDDVYAITSAEDVEKAKPPQTLLSSRWRKEKQNHAVRSWSVTRCGMYVPPRLPA